MHTVRFPIKPTIPMRIFSDAKTVSAIVFGENSICPLLVLLEDGTEASEGLSVDIVIIPVRGIQQANIRTTALQTMSSLFVLTVGRYWTVLIRELLYKKRPPFI